jgi:parallel beta-helix repeat protein
MAVEEQKMMEAGFTRVSRKISLMLIVVFFCPFAYGKVIYVDDDTLADFANIQAAIDTAEYGDTVSVAPGTYYENIVLKNGINLSGAGADVTIIDANEYGDVVDARANDVTICGFTLRNSGENDLGHMNCGVYVYGSYAPIIRNNVIVHNKIGIGVWDGANPDVRNNIIKYNYDGFYLYGSEEKPSNPGIINNTIVNNEIDGIMLRVMVSPVIVNNIITGHAYGINHNYVTGSPTISYNNLWHNDVNYMRDNSTDDTLAGPGSISVDPNFAEPGYWADVNNPNIAVILGTPYGESNDPNTVWIDGDYHLKSQAGRWDPISESWIVDDVTSPCIDAGDPNSPIGHEPLPNGGVINMGAYGGTEQASLSLSTAVANGVIIDQQLNAAEQGYTVVRLCGSYYEMGYAHGDLLADYVVRSVEETKELFGGLYSGMRTATADSVWKPAEIEQELDGMVDALAERHPAAGIDKLDLKMFNGIGDLRYGCRSHTCWGRYVTAPTKTLSTRRLDFPTPIGSLNHHVLFVYVPNDGSAKWINLGFPGMVTAAQGVNEFGTLVSLHDYNSWGADISSGRMPRTIACRYALTYLPSSDLSRQLSDIFAELQKYEIMTGTFLNYYAPEGHGGVMTCNPHRTGSDFYNLRMPQDVWHHGEAMITTNQWTNGNYTPADEDFGADVYYNDETSKTHESHWSLVDPVDSQDGLQRLSVAYRGKGDMTIWADGRIDGIGRTARLEYEWFELFGPYKDDYGYEQDETAGLAEPAEALMLSAK